MTSAKKAKQPPRRKSTTGTAEAVAYPWLKSYPAGVDWQATFTPRPLSQLLDEAVARYPDRPCTYFLGKIMTFAEAGALSDRVAAGLQALGLKKGDRVGLLLPNTPTYVIFYYGVLKAGGTVVNFNPLYTVEEIDEQVRDSGTDIMVTLDLAILYGKVEALIERGGLKRAVVASFAALLPPLKATLFRVVGRKDLARPLASQQIVLAAALMDNDGRHERVAIDPADDVAVLQYTGGTTGTPKGAMLTHANLTINVEQVRMWATNLSGGQERVLAVLPFFHVFAMTTVLNLGMAMGCEMVLMPRFELDEALKLIHKRRPTVLPGVPTLYNAMMNHPKLSRYDLSSLKFCISGGAPLPLEVKKGFEAVSGCTLVEGYGLSETSPVAACNPVDGPVREGSIGIPLPGTVISIRAIDEPEREMPLGENGELCIAGPQVMKGYWKRAEETRQVMVGAFLRTGDVGHMDADGFVYIVDRLKDMIICSGFKVYPRRIEEALYAHPAVEEATVVGIPDDYRGEAPKAFVKLRTGATISREDLLAFLQPKISKIEMPAEIEFRDELPKTMIGKLSKKELRAEARAKPRSG